MASFVQQWKSFLLTYCERGHNVIPRWAFQGLHFLVLASDPLYSVHLSEDQFQQLRDDMNECVAHVVGDKQMVKGRSEREDELLSLLTAISLREHAAVRTSNQTDDKPGQRIRTDPIDRIRKACRDQDLSRDTLLQNEKRIGRCLQSDVSKEMQTAAFFAMGKRAPFNWQRLEKKIGSGKFGSVFVVMNLDNCQMLAMKQIKFDRNHRAMKALVEEVENLERLQHPNLVRYYGTEVHREELLIFMEYCSEGTLERVCQEGLDLFLVRRYTMYLLKGVSYMHEHNIVHRDIKPTNIFITNRDMLKLGDFGSSVRLWSQNTVRGELTDWIGTPAYMAPGPVFIVVHSHIVHN